MKIWLPQRSWTKRKVINCSSTNTLALEEAKLFPLRTGWIYTMKQAKGRGRYSNQWISLHGNVMTSFFCTIPSNISQMSSRMIMIMASLSVLSVIKKLLPIAGQHRLRLKWPNDIILDRGKISGVLVEHHAPVFPQTQHAQMIVGIGINVRLFPRGMHQQATSLKQSGIAHLKCSMIQTALEECFLSFVKKSKNSSGFFHLLCTMRRHLFPNEEIFFAWYQKNIH